MEYRVFVVAVINELRAEYLRDNFEDVRGFLTKGSAMLSLFIYGNLLEIERIIIVLIYITNWNTEDENG
jgi:hypothetical protein